MNVIWFILVYLYITIQTNQQHFYKVVDWFLFHLTVPFKGISSISYNKLFRDLISMKSRLTKTLKTQLTCMPSYDPASTLSRR